MSNVNPIVTFREVNRAFNQGKRGNEAVMKIAQGEAEAATGDPVEAAMVLASLGNALKTMEEHEVHPGVMIAPDDGVASVLQSFLAERARDADQLEPLPTGGEEAKFDEDDLVGWMPLLMAVLKKKKRHDWLQAPADPEDFPGKSNNTRLALLGDWGTGLYGAPVCAASIQNDARGYGLMLHVGDVYYSGADTEIHERFLNLWPKRAGAVSRACNSNHEMYSGGKAYFDLTLPQFGQKASYFALQNDHWLLVGLDSAYNDPDNRYDKAVFGKEQVDWLRNIINNADPQKKVILFTHHQPISHFDRQNVLMTDKDGIGDLLVNQKIFAWYWGHEHRCVMFDKHPAWGFYGRCVGHSGVPYFRDHLEGAPFISKGAQETEWLRLPARNMVPAAQILDGPNYYLSKHQRDYGPHGYMTLEFSDGHLNEIVHAPDGTEIFNQQLV